MIVLDQAFIMIIRMNKAKMLAKYIACDCKYKFNNSNEK